MDIRVERQDNIFTVTIDRPEVRNAIDRPAADALREAFSEFDRDEKMSVAILYGDHGHFCAGADLKALAARDSEKMNRVESGAVGPMGPTRTAISKPVIAAVAGSCVAGGLELALWCDLRIAEQNALFGVYCRRWGAPLMDGGTVRLPRIVGQGRALDMILTGRAVNAHEALHIGLVSRVVPKGESLAAARDMATLIANFPQNCLRNDRLSCYEQSNMGIDAALFNEHEHGLQTLESEEIFSGAARFAGGAGRHGQLDAH